ncbi:hypothetical protein FRB95_013750 [Tulasnella sp. JGI-2019a]|nr:hypothetical protein FRB95_013750 [Tulasnella sp. JGI-2019a]
MVSRAAVLSISYLAVSAVVAAPVFDKAKDVSGVDSHAHHHHHHHGVHNKHHRSYPKGLGLQKREDMMSTSANQTSTIQAPAPAIGDDSDDDEDDFILQQNNSTTVNSTMAIPQPNSTDDSTSLIDPGLRRRDFQRSKVDDQGWKQHRGQGDDSDSNHGDGHKHRHWEPRKGRTGHHGGHKPHHHRKHKKGRIVDRHPNPMGPDLEGSGGDHDRRFRGLQKRGLDGRGSDRIGGGNDGHKHHNRKGWPGHHGHGAFHKRSPYANLERLD